MSNFAKVQLAHSAILNVPFETYSNNFTFIVNGEKFQTSKLASDLISKKISKIHLNDPKFDLFVINTTNSGDFSTILNFINFSEVTISTEEIPFLVEIISILEIESLNYHSSDEIEDLTEENCFSIIQKHLTCEPFFQKNLSTEIDFIASHFHSLCETQKEQLEILPLNIICKILSSDNLSLISENQLLNFVNNLYLNDQEYSILYEFIQFENVSSECMKHFLTLYDHNDITCGMWTRLSCRLEKELNSDNKNQKRYTNQMNLLTQTQTEIIEFEPKDSFNGIIQYLKTQSNGQIEKEIDITASSIYDNSETRQPSNVIRYGDSFYSFYSQDQPNNWLCFDFKHWRIIPTDYTIKSYNVTQNYRSLKSWAIEGSSDNLSWIPIDTQENCAYLNGSLLTHTFHIEKQQNKEFRYIRIRSTGPCWTGEHYLNIGRFELYGKLIQQVE